MRKEPPSEWGVSSSILKKEDSDLGAMDGRSEREPRLQELRERSRKMNAELQAIFDSDAGLPFSTKQKHKEALRFTIHLRPEFDGVKEEKSEHYKGSGDEITMFIHLGSKGTFKELRYYSDMANDSELVRHFFWELFAEHYDELSRVVQQNSDEDLLGLVGERLRQNSHTELFLDCKQFGTLKEASNFFNSGLTKDYHPNILRNLSRIGLDSLFEQKIIAEFQSEPARGRDVVTKIKQDLEHLAGDYLDIKLGHDKGQVRIRDLINYGQKGSVEQIINQMIHAAIKKNRATIFGRSSASNTKRIS